MYNINDDNGYISEHRYHVETEFTPSAIDCWKNYIYVSGRDSDLIKIYSSYDLTYVDSYRLRGVINAASNAFAVNNNIKVFTDGIDAVDIFEWNSTKNVCPFYMHMGNNNNLS